MQRFAIDRGLPLVRDCARYTGKVLSWVHQKWCIALWRNCMYLKTKDLQLSENG
jgi:hypothetical protein